MTNRIVIDSEFDVEFDGSRCYTLIHKKIITGTGRGSHLLKDKNSIGKTREIELGFYGTFGGALIAYADKCIGNRATALEDVLKVISECMENIKKVSAPKDMQRVSAKE
jgi:hypothetical protein